jgi:hypothetical protein
MQQVFAQRCESDSLIVVVYLPKSLSSDNKANDGYSRRHH